MLQRIDGNRPYNPFSLFSSEHRKNYARRVLVQSHNRGTGPIPKLSFSDIEKYCIETWSDWGASRYRRVQTTSVRSVHVVSNVPSPDECSEILWRIVQAEKAYMNTNRCRFYNNALVNGAVEGLKVCLPRLPASCVSSSHREDMVGMHDETETLSEEFVPRTMLSMAYLGCHLAWEEQMDSLCQKIPLMPCHSLRQVDDCLRALRISRHKCQHTRHLDRQAGILLQEGVGRPPDQLIRMLMLGGNIAYHIVYQRDVPRDTLRGILAGLARLPDVDDDPAVLFKCLAIVGTSVAFTDCLRGSHIDSDLDTTIHKIAQNIIHRLVVMCLSEAGASSSKGMDANILHAMFPFLAWVVFQSRDLHFLDEEQRRCVHDVFDQSVRVRESMKSKHTVSAAQADMYNTVRNMGLSAQVEQHIRGISVDIVLPDHHIAIEVDGPSHSFRNDSMLEIGHGSFKKAMLDRIGWTLVSIPLETWDSVERRAQSEYMRSVLPI